jgi:hypothetical protein
VLLDLVRDPGALAERMGDHRSVLVRAAGSEVGVPLCHLVFQGSRFIGQNMYQKGEQVQDIQLVRNRCHTPLR